MSRNALARQTMLEELLEGQPNKKKLKTGRTAPMSTLMLEAQRAIEHKNFGGAIATLSDAIANCHDRKADLIHVFDLRCNAYIRQGTFDMALKDAKQMIRIDRADFRGYLRCAKVELQLSNFEKAKRVCELALRSIDKDTKGRHHLQACLLRAEEALKTKVIYEKGTDPMLVLPSEILEIILAYFDYREVVAILRVSKAWHERLNAVDVLTHSIDTSQTYRTLTLQQMKAAFLRLCKAPTSLFLHRLHENAASFAGSELKQWLKWENLRSLVITDGKVSVRNLRFDKLDNLRSLHIGAAVEFKRDLNGLLQQLPRLEQLCLKAEFPNSSIGSTPVYYRLRELILEPFQDSQHCLTFNLPTHQCILPNLHRLQLKQMYFPNGLDLSQYENLAILSLHNVRIDQPANLRTPSSLQDFALVGEFPSIYPQPEEIKFPAGNLVSIGAQGSHAIRFLGYAIRQGLDGGNLRKLRLKDYVAYSRVGNREVVNNLDTLSSIPGFQVFENVEDLELSDDNLRDNDAKIVSSLFPNIRTLELESEQITEVFISEIVKRLARKLKYVITIRNCSSVSQKVVPWALSRGVTIESRRTRTDSSRVTGSKSVRYDT